MYGLRYGKIEIEKENKNMNENIKEFTGETFQDEIKTGLTLVDFYADWCMPCKMLSPTISAIAEEYAGRISVAKINIDSAPGIAAKYGVMSIPTVILFKDGIAVDKKIGLAGKGVYEQLINASL